MSSIRRKAGMLSAAFCMMTGIILAVPAAAQASNSYYTVQNGYTNKCLDQDYNNPGNGATVQMWDCWGGPNQKWAAQNCNWLGQCELVNLWSGLCLDADSNHITQNGDTVQAWTCWGGANQYWYVGAPNISNDYWQVINAADGKCLDADANNAHNGERVQLWDCWYTGPFYQYPAPNQTWHSPGAPPI